MTPTHLSQRRGIRLASIAAFVYLTSVISVMASERVYWYWAGLNVDSVFVMSAFYVVPTASALWALAHIRARQIHQVILGGAIFAFITEGILTPVIYADGPLPFLASLFVGWHGMLAFVGFWYLTHLWLVARRTRLLAVASALFGSLWGVWAFVASFTDPPDLTEGVGRILAPDEFALYVIGVGAVLAASHWLISFVWPKGWKPTRASTWSVAFVAIVYFAVGVVPAVPWAPIKLSLLIGGTLWLLRRTAENEQDGQPTIFDRLAGSVRLRDVVAILPMPLAAAAIYGTIWAIDPGESASVIVYWVFVAGQVLGGAIAYVWSARRALERSRSGTSKAALALSRE